MSVVVQAPCRTEPAAVTIGPVPVSERGLSALAAALGTLDVPSGSAAFLMILPSPEPARRPRADRPPVPSVTQLRPRTVKRAIDAMKAQPARPFTVTELAAVAGVSARTLQAAFRQHTGMSPMNFLRELRLTRFHDDLLAADPRQLTVAAIAHRWGLPHLGRLAALYRARYGVNPSATLHSNRL